MNKIFLSLWICSLLTAAAASCCLTQRPSHEHEEDKDGDLDYESDVDDGLFDNDDVMMMMIRMSRRVNIRNQLGHVAFLLQTLKTVQKEKFIAEMK